MLDLAYDAIFIQSLPDSVITYWNRGAEDLYGWRASEALGWKPGELLHTVLDRPREEIVAEVKRAGRWSGSIVQTRRDGTQMMVEARWALQADLAGHPVGILEINRDVTELRTTLSQLEFANQVSTQLGSSLEPETVLDRLLTLAVAAAQATHATFARIEGEDGIVEASQNGHGQAIPAGLRWRLSVPAVLEAVRTRRPTPSGPNEASHFSEKLEPYMADLNYRLNVPLVMGEEVIGLLIVGRREAAFSREQQMAVARMATPAALALHNSRLFQQARQGVEAKREFLNLAGHELRTPLTVVKGYFSLMGDGNFGAAPDAWNRPMSIIKAELDTLERMVESLLVAARADADQMNPSVRLIDLVDEAQAAIRRARPRIELERAECTLVVPDGAVQALGDPDHLALILDNLIGNGLDYSVAPAQITVEVANAPDPSILVRDAGIGIPDDSRDKVFERFVRLAPHVMATRSGSGLGLFISRSLARAMGGDVVIVDSELGRGSTIAVTLQKPD